MKKIKYGLILNGEKYELSNSELGRCDACKKCDLNKVPDQPCADYSGAFCYSFEEYFGNGCFYFKEVKETEEIEHCIRMFGKEYFIVSSLLESPKQQCDKCDMEEEGRKACKCFCEELRFTMKWPSIYLKGPKNEKDLHSGKSNR